MAFFRKYWFTLLGASYGGFMAAAGVPITTLPFWIGMTAIRLTYIGARVVSE